MSSQLYVSEIFSSIQGEGMLAGRRQIFIRLTDCNLDCRYCDTNFEKSAVGHLESRPGSGVLLDIPQPMSLTAISAIVDDWCSKLPGAHHSISFTGGEPLLHVDILVDWFIELRKSLPLHLETNGTLSDALNKVKQHLDYISMDIKLPSTASCTDQLWDVHAQFLRAAHGAAVSVKIVVNDETSDDEIGRVCDIVASVDQRVPLFLQPMSQPDGTVGLSATQILHLQELAASRLPDIRVIPQMHKLLGAL